MSNRMSPSIKYQLITNEDQQEEITQNVFDKGFKIMLTCLLLFILLLYKYPFEVYSNVESIEQNGTQIRMKIIQDQNDFDTEMTEVSITSEVSKTTTQSLLVNNIENSTESIKSTMSALEIQSTQLTSLMNDSTESISTKTSLATQTTQSFFINNTTKSDTTSNEVNQTSWITSTLKRYTYYPASVNINSNYSESVTNRTLDNRVLNSTEFPIKSELTTSSTIKPATTAAAPVPVPKNYFVYTSTCHMPYIDPHQKDVMKIYRPKAYKNCTKDKDLVSSSFDNVTRRYTLHLNGNAADIHCCYQNILRAGLGNSADKTFKALPCVNFHQDFVVPEHIDALIVKCSHKRSSKVSQLSGFSYIQKKNSTTTTTKEAIANVSQSSTRSPNILMLGIDSLSKMNFRRTMPLTYQYLSEQKWFELQGYNKMGDNTFPNLMALLTGYDNEQAYHECNPKIAGGLDKCPFLWHNFRKNGYHTAYAEDWVQYSTFNYLKKGFVKQPTEYYIRPLALAMEKLLKMKREANIPYCVGQKHYGEYIYDYAMQFANFFRQEKYFGFFWTNSFSHNDFSLPSSMDKRMLKYFKEMEQSGLMENTIVVFFSDHGMRFGSLRKLQNGFLEERWPMFYLSLPKWFQQEHKLFVQALRINKNRLISPYDIHVTMHHLLKLSQEDYKFEQPQGCQKCQSIFYEIPENRTCEDAGITEHWCTCGSFTNVSLKDAQVKLVSELTIDKINQYLAGKGFKSKCSNLKLGKIINASKKSAYKDDLDLFFRLKLEAEPKKALFEATVRYDLKLKQITLDVELVSRLNSYENDSHCIEDKAAKKYCICA